jgi:hypothetical protein
VSLSILVAALAVVSFYLFLVIASFIVEMPVAMQSRAFVGGLLALVFALSLVIAYRRIAPRLWR